MPQQKKNIYCEIDNKSFDTATLLWDVKASLFIAAVP
jgi:hypothetical protein